MLMQEYMFHRNPHPSGLHGALKHCCIGSKARGQSSIGLKFLLYVKTATEKKKKNTSINPSIHAHRQQKVCHIFWRSVTRIRR